MGLKELDEDFAEYTKCLSCNQEIMNCNCNCPYCGNRGNCLCEVESLKIP